MNKHLEQLIENEVVQMMSVKTEIVRIANVRKFLSKAKSELMNLQILS